MKKLIFGLLLGISSILLAPDFPAANLAATDHFVIKSPDFSAADKLIAERAKTNPTATTSAETPDAVLSDAQISIANALEPNQPTSATANYASAPILPQTPGYIITSVVNTKQEYVSLSHNLSTSDIYRFGRLIFAHNTPALFGNLFSLNVGTTISISEGGISKLYQVQNIVLYEKVSGYLNGDPEFINKLASNAMGYDRALMTCAGTPLGGGDATHRLVVYVNSI